MLSNKRPLPSHTSHVGFSLQPLRPLKKPKRSREPGDPVEPVCYSSDQIKEFTNNFSKENLIGETQFGKVYRGLKYGQPVTVKIWDEKADTFIPFGDDFDMLDDEKRFLTDPNVKNIPNLAKLDGFYSERELMAVVYDLDPQDTLHNFILKEDFTWRQRLEVALAFACLIEKLHSSEKPYLIFNIDAAHIMLDQDFKPWLFEFGLMSSGIDGQITKRKRMIFMSPGYIDIYFCKTGLYRLINDVYSYGTILLSLITKRLWVRDAGRITTVCMWATEKYSSQNVLVHHSLKGHPGYCHEDGVELTKLGMQCTKTDNVGGRPSMHEVVKILQPIVDKL